MQRKVVYVPECIYGNIQEIHFDSEKDCLLFENYPISSDVKILAAKDKYDSIVHVYLRNKLEAEIFNYYLSGGEGVDFCGEGWYDFIAEDDRDFYFLPEHLRNKWVFRKELKKTIATEIDRLKEYQALLDKTEDPANQVDWI